MGKSAGTFVESSGVAPMSNFPLHSSELRQLGGLLAALLEDSDMMAELSLIEQEGIQRTSAALRRFFPIVDKRGVSIDGHTTDAIATLSVPV